MTCCRFNNPRTGAAFAYIDSDADPAAFDLTQTRVVEGGPTSPIQIVRLILGKAGRGVSPENLQAFSDAMSSVLINRYADGLLNFRSDEQFQIMPLKGKNTDKLTRVRTRIRLESGSYAPVS